MKNVLIVGVGGQGNVLASRVLAQAASQKGWQVRTAETIGMAQRGGSVASHVRMGDGGEPVYAPLVPGGSADLVVALEPGEGLRALPYLAPDGLLVSARTTVPSVMSSLANDVYDGRPVLDALRWRAPHFLAVDDERLCDAAGSRKALNTCMLAAAVAASLESARDGGPGFGLGGAIGKDDLVRAMRVRVRPKFAEMNEKAIDAAFDAVEGGGLTCR